MKIQSVPRSKHSVSAIIASQLMLYREIIAVCSETHTKHTNTLCSQNVALLNVSTDGSCGPAGRNDTDIHRCL
jgi:hypothetical protein